MNETLRLIRMQSVTLVDIFAAAILFIFVAFLVLYINFLTTTEAENASDPGGLKTVRGSPYSYSDFREALDDHVSRWREKEFLEMRRDTIVMHLRGTAGPEEVSISRIDADPSILDNYLDRVEKNWDTLGAPYVSTNYRPFSPHVTMFVYSSWNYYDLRDRIEERGFSWSEVTVPGEMPDPDEIGVYDGADTDAMTNPELASVIDQLGQPVKQEFGDLLSPEAYESGWNQLMAQMPVETPRPPPMSVPEITDNAQGLANELQPLIIMEGEIASVLVPIDDAEPDKRSNLVWLLAACIGLMILLGSLPKLLRLRGLWLLRQQSKSRDKQSVLPDATNV